MASEYLKWKYRDVRPDAPAERTKKQRLQNWWHYHKWHIGVGIAAVAIAGNLAWHALTQVHPDYQIAYVGAYPLSEEEAAAWEERLSALGTDCGGDGRVVVRLNQYPTGGSGDDPMYAAASNVELMADLDACESYFFLLEDPDGFQRDWEVLREDWLPAGNGLFLARREFWEDRTCENLADCHQLWDALSREGIS